jgi:hypothetical protein
LEPQQDTPPCNRNKPNYVLFGKTVDVQTPTSKLKPGSAIIFEFKHFKPKKKKVSTKAWALMEYDEFVNNDQSKLALEMCVALAQLPPAGSTGLAGVCHTPAVGLLHPWGASSCTREAAPLTYCVATLSSCCFRSPVAQPASVRRRALYDCTGCACSPQI